MLGRGDNDIDHDCSDNDINSDYGDNHSDISPEDTNTNMYSPPNYVQVIEFLFYFYFPHLQV